MNRVTIFCPSLGYPARGQTSQGNLRPALAQGATLDLHAAPQDLYGTKRDSLVSVAHAARDGEPRLDPLGPWLPLTSHLVMETWLDLEDVPLGDSDDKNLI